MSNLSRKKFLNRGDILFVASNATVIAFNRISGKKIRTYGGFSDKVVAIEIVNDILYGASWDGTVRSFAVSTGSLLNTYAGSQGILNCLRVISEPIPGTGSLSIFAGSSDSKVRWWTANGRDSSFAFDTKDSVLSIAVNVSLPSDTSPISSIAAGCADGSIFVWSLPDGAKRWRTKSAHAGPIDNIAISSIEEGRTKVFSSSSGNDDGTTITSEVRTWALLTGERGPSYLNDSSVTTFLIHESLIYCATIDGVINSFQLKSGAIDQSFDDAHPGFRINSLIFHGETLYSAADDGTIIGWSPSSGLSTVTFSSHEHGIVGIGIAHEKLYSAAVDTLQDEIEVKSWNLDSGDCLQTFNPSAPAIQSFALTHDNKFFIAFQSHDKVQIKDRETGELIEELEGVPAYISTLIFAGGRVYVGCIDGTICVFDSKTHSVKRQFEGHSAPIISLHYSDGSLYSTSVDGTLRSWDAYSGELNHTFAGWKGPVSCVATHSGSLFVGSVDGSLKLYHEETAELITEFSLGDEDQGQAVHGLQFINSSDIIVAYNSILLLLRHTETSESFQIIAREWIPGAADELAPSLSFQAQRNVLVYSPKQSMIILGSGRDIHLYKLLSSGRRRGAIGLEYIDSFPDHATQITDLTIQDSSLLTSSTDIISYDLAMYSRFGVKSAFIETKPGGAAGNRNIRSLLEWILAIIMLIIETLQILGVNSEVEPTSLPLTLFPAFSSAYRLLHLIFVCLISIGLIIVVAIEMYSKAARFLNPDSITLRKVYLATLLGSKLLIRVLYMPALLFTSSFLLCLLLDGDCFLQLIISLIAFLPYCVLTTRLTLSGEQLSSINIGWNIFSRASDRFYSQYRHPLSLSKSGARHQAIYLLIKTLHILNWIIIWFYLQAIIVWVAILIVLSVAQAANTFWNVPYVRRSANRFQSILDFIVMGIFLSWVPEHLASADPFVDSLFLLRVLLIVLFFFLGYISWSIPIWLAPNSKKSGLAALQAQAAAAGIGASGARERRGLTEFASLLPQGPTSPSSSSTANSPAEASTSTSIV